MYSWGTCNSKLLRSPAARSEGVEVREGSMKLPIDTAGMTFMPAAPAKPVTDFDTRQHKADENGELLFNLQVVALDWQRPHPARPRQPGSPPPPATPTTTTIAAHPTRPPRSAASASSIASGKLVELAAWAPVA